MMRIELCSPVHPDAANLLDSLSDTLARITGSSGSASFDPVGFIGPGAAFFVAYSDSGDPVGCGGYRPLQHGVAELKRMFAIPGTRGVGTAILHHLEQRAATDGYRAIWLETRVVNQRAARFYARSGYTQIANFGRYAGRDEAVCFGKDLPCRAS